jgi:hypothetical protein
LRIFHGPKTPVNKTQAVDFAIRDCLIQNLSAPGACMPRKKERAEDEGTGAVDRGADARSWRPSLRSASVFAVVMAACAEISLVTMFLRPARFVFC